MSNPIEAIIEDRAVTVIRADEMPDAAALAEALVAGGIRAIEFTFTTKDIERHIADAATTAAIVGAGTVVTRVQAEAAIAAGARFLVTPGLSPAVAEVAAETHIPLLMGAFTPSEAMRAMDLGADAVKIFPASTAGPAHFASLLGPFPALRLIGSGGIDHRNAKAFLDAGAVAVTAGSSVVSAAAVASADWAGITERARRFVESF